MQVIISVSQLIGSVMGLSTTRFQESLAIVNNYANSDKSIQVRLVDWVAWFPCLPEYSDVVLHLYSFFSFFFFLVCVCCWQNLFVKSVMVSVFYHASVSLILLETASLHCFPFVFVPLSSPVWLFSQHETLFEHAVSTFRTLPCNTYLSMPFPLGKMWCDIKVIAGGCSGQSQSFWDTSVIFRAQKG